MAEITYNNQTIFLNYLFIGYMSAYIPVKCKSLKYVIFMLEIVRIYVVSQNVKSLGLLEIIPDNRLCGSIVNTKVYGSPPSKWKF